MNILFIPSYFFPERAASSYISENRYEAFAESGIRMKVFVPRPCRGLSEEEKKVFKIQKKRDFLFEKKLYVYRFPMFDEGNNAFFRAFRYTLICVRQFFLGLFDRNADLIFSTSTPPIQGAIAALLKKIKGVPLVYNLQDVFPDSLVATGLTRKYSLLWKIGRVIENFTYKNADRIIVISDGFKRNIMEKGVSESKIDVVYNWVDENEVVHVDRCRNLLFEKYSLDRDLFYVTYNGNIGLTQNMDLLLDVAKELLPYEHIRLVIMGDGVYKPIVKKRVVEEALKNVIILPFEPYENISHVFSMGDVGLVISKENVGQNSVPSKTWSIMSASRPVLACFDEGSEIQHIVEDNDLGVFIKAGHRSELFESIISLSNNPEKCKRMGENGRGFVLKYLTREIGTSQYVNIVKSLLDNDRN